MAIEDEVSVRRFCAAVEGERPAEEVKALLGPSAIGRRGERAAERLQAGDPILRLRGFKALAVATREEEWEDRAFAALADMVAAAMPAAPSLETGPRKESVRAEAAARIDFGGGWTDTPPHSIERGGTVLNAAITLHGSYPIVVEAEWLPEPRLVLDSRDIGASLEPERVGEVLAYSNPADPFALLKAAVVLRNIVPPSCDPGESLERAMRTFGGGLRLSTQTSIPRGSGLGTSSIMAGAVLVCLARLLGIELTGPRLFGEVLYLEQMLTTGGGWQDQVGGLVGGIKLVTTEPGLPQKITVEPVELPGRTRSELAGRLTVIYTGQRRLAKDLLRAIMARWMARDPALVWILKEIGRLASEMRASLERGDIDSFGAMLGEHWELNKRMDPGCTNGFIDGLYEAIGPYVAGGKLAGAGGGGFMIAVARDPQAAVDLGIALEATYPGTQVGVWPCSVPDLGVVVS